MKAKFRATFTSASKKVSISSNTVPGSREEIVKCLKKLLLGWGTPYEDVLKIFANQDYVRRLQDKIKKLEIDIDRKDSKVFRIVEGE